MFFWHLGGTVLIARYVFRDPLMDLRWLVLGALLPDIVDKPIGSIIWHDTFGAHRIFAHALVLPVIALGAAVVFTARGSTARKIAVTVVLGWFVHLVLDGAWASPEAFLWPFFGFDFPVVARSDFATLFGDMVSNPWVWMGEALGAGYLAYLWRRHLAAPGSLRRFFGDGHVPMRAPQSS